MGNWPDKIPAEYSGTDAEKDAYERGWNHGHGIACCNVPSIGDKINRSVDWVGLGEFVTAENIAEYHQCLCFAAEENSRCYSPFEFTAHEFNSAGEFESEALWEAFDAGIADSIMADLAGYEYEDSCCD